MIRFEGREKMSRSKDVASCSESGRRDDGAAAALNPFSVLIISGATRQSSCCSDVRSCVVRGGARKVCLGKGRKGWCGWRSLKEGLESAQ